MIDSSLLQKISFIDIETSGQCEDFHDLNPRLVELWKKRCDWIRKNNPAEANLDNSQLWENKASLHPEFCRVVCVTFGAFQKDFSKKIMSFTGEEKDILEKTNKILDNIHNNGWHLGGHTIKNFDIPVLGKRMLANRINPSKLIVVWNKKPWESNFLDIAEMYSFGGWGHNHSSLDLMAAHRLS